MKNLDVSISESEFAQLGLKDDRISYSELLRLIKRQEMKQTLEECLVLAEKYGLSNMTMEEIDEEVKAVRANAKNNR